MSFIFIKNKNLKKKYIYKFNVYNSNNGCLGSHNDEERSEMRYVM